MPQPDNQKPCLVLVEDDDAVRRSVQLLLQSRGYHVRAYPSAVGLAQDALALGCACIIADLMMPQVDAIQLLAELKAASWKGKAILMSGYLDKRWEVKAQVAGYDCILAKPISDSVLIRTVESLLPDYRVS